MDLPDTAYRIDLDEQGQDGHAFGRPPGLRPVQWPRSRVNGLPMAHLFTVRVPAQYRCAGPDLVGLSVFQADDHVSVDVHEVDEVIAGATPPPHQPDAAAFWSALAGYAQQPHPQECYREDDIGGGWAWIWRTEAELAELPGPLPDPATRQPGYASQHGTDAWHSDRPARPLRLVARVDDPNVGKPYDEWGETEPGYVDMYSEAGERLGLQRFQHECHFGGTATPPNGGPGFGPYYLAFDEALGEANLGGDGTAHLDLAANQLDWTCG